MTSTAPVYVLLSNDGEEDFILTSDKVLHNELAKIRQEKKVLNAKINAQYRAAGRQPPKLSDQADISDITRTHKLWVHRRFYPFVAIQHTWIPTQVYSGNATLAAGGSIQFDMEYAGEFYNKIALHLIISSGSITASATPGEIHSFAYAPMLGNRIVKSSEFKVNTSALDKYDQHAANSYYEFEVSADQERGYLSSIGQERTLEGRVIPADGVPVTADAVTTVLGEMRTFTNGPQTPKVTHDEIELFIRGQFWWNRESEDAFPTLLVPNGQRILKYELEKLENCVTFLDENFDAIAYDNTLWSTRPTYTTQELIVQNIYLNPEINDIYIDKIGFNMVRLYLQQNASITSSSFDKRLDLFKWPIEEIRFAAIPTSYLEGGNNGGDNRQWNKYSYDRIEKMQVLGTIGSQATNGAFADGDALLAEATDFLRSSVHICDPLFRTVNFTVQGLKLYEDLPAKFFRDFIPAAFSERFGRVSGKSECQWGLINLNQKLGSPDASGYVNTSRVRETYLKGTLNALVGTATIPEVTLFLEGKGINFTFITNGNIIIRFVA